MFVEQIKSLNSLVWATLYGMAFALGWKIVAELFNLLYLVY